MPATVSSRSRMADASHQSEPAAKKQRLDSASSTPAKSKSNSSQSQAKAVPQKSLGDALLTNGTAKKLEAKSGKIQAGRAAHAVNDAKSSVGTTVGQKGVMQKEDVIEISSDSDSDEDEDEEEGAEEEVQSDNDDDEEMGEAEKSSRSEKQLLDGTGDSDGDEDMNEDEDDEEEEPAFGEMLAAAPIDVQAAFDQSNETTTSLALQHHPNRTALSSSAAATTSLATVLSQALKTNDRALLETCFMTNDLASVRSTIQRLPSSQVGALLHHIADKMHKRPGRASNLMVWIQWSLVSHGGYLARRKDIVSKLGALNRVIKERANGLQPLLVLKGKLDMLAAQLELRREVMLAGRRERDEDEDVVIYVEGQENDKIQQDDAEEDEEEEADADVDLDSRIVADKLAAQDDSEADDDDDVDDDSSEDEEVSDTGFSDQEQDEQDSASDLVEHDDSDDDDEEDDEDEEETLVAPAAQSKKRRKA